MARAQAPRAVRTPSAAARRPPPPFLAEKLKTPKKLYHAKTRKAIRGVKKERRSRRSIQRTSRRPSDCRRAAGSSGPRCRSACESTRHDNWIPADWLIRCFLFFGQWMGMQLQPNQDQESRAQSRISFAVPLPLQHRHHQRPHQNRLSTPPQALLLPRP